MANSKTTIQVIKRRQMERKKQPKPAPPYDRPKTRGECFNLPRPCPYYGCRHHLKLEAFERGRIELSLDDISQTHPTCSLDVADHGPSLLADIAAMLHLTPERVRQIEEQAMAKLKRDGPI